MGLNVLTNVNKTTNKIEKIFKLERALLLYRVLISLLNCLVFPNSKKFGKIGKKFNI